MSIFLTVLLLLAFFALVGTGVTTWQCMKLTRPEADDAAALNRWLVRLAVSLGALVIFGGGYLLLGHITGAL